MHVVLMCATKRGRLFLQKLIELVPDIEITVFSFKEDPWEPPFFDEIRDLTQAHGGRFIEARQVGNDAYHQFWQSSEIDIAFAVSWRYLIPPDVYKRPKLSTYVFHDSLLPAYRGFSPTVWAIINGENHTGVTLFKIADEVDSGDIIDQERVPIGPNETISEIMDRVTQTYLQLLEKNLEGLLAGTLSLSPQDHTKATYTCKRVPEDNEIDWTASSGEIHNLIRALSHPYPGAYTFLSGHKIRVWSVECLPSPGFVGRIPGRVIQVSPGKGTVVLTGDGILLINEVQTETGSIENASGVINRLSFTLGQ